MMENSKRIKGEAKNGGGVFHKEVVLGFEKVESEDFGLCDDYSSTVHGS